MTYNFDPDQWYENELNYLKALWKAGKMTEEGFRADLAKLNDRHEEMWKRLDGTYRVNPSSE